MSERKVVESSIPTSMQDYRPIISVHETSWRVTGLTPGHPPPGTITPRLAGWMLLYFCIWPAWVAGIAVPMMIDPESFLFSAASFLILGWLGLWVGIILGRSAIDQFGRFDMGSAFRSPLFLASTLLLPTLWLAPMFSIAITRALRGEWEQGDGGLIITGIYFALVLLLCQRLIRLAYRIATTTHRQSDILRLRQEGTQVPARVLRMNDCHHWHLGRSIVEGTVRVDFPSGSRSMPIWLYSSSDRVPTTKSPLIAFVDDSGGVHVDFDFTRPAHFDTSDRFDEPSD